MKTTTAFLFFTFFLLCACNAQNKDGFSHADTLRGSITPERAWWDVLRYDIEVTPDFANKSIQGKVKIVFSVTKDISDKKTLSKAFEDLNYKMQVDLQQPLIIDKIVKNDSSLQGDIHHPETLKAIGVTTIDLKYERKDNYAIVSVPHLPLYSKNAIDSIIIFYHGTPREAVRPPWDGGWIFTRDELGRPWMSVACEGLGASAWYPCKDHLSDEPDSGASLSITVADTLVAVANGRLKEKKTNTGGTVTYTWAVVNPINNYNIIPYIGKYVSWHEDYSGEKGKLDCDYWVLDYNLGKAQPQFKAVDSMLKCFEYWFGPYPFYEDGYKLVESPHLGMEHQSAVAYGNKFQYGYKGTDLSGSGWGLKWDFIIVHESGHEWFGNNITCKDLADEWIHEGFTDYSETIYTGYYFGKDAGNAYNRGLRKNIQNKTPIIGRYGVNDEPNGTDQYYKGSNMIHTIRQVIDNDSLFREILRGLNKTFYHHTVSSRQIEEYISLHAKKDFSKVFDQYLRTVQIPVLEYKQKGYAISYRWANCIRGFNMPVKINFKGGRWIRPTASWQKLSMYPEGDSTFTADPDFYINVKKQE